MWGVQIEWACRGGLSEEIPSLSPLEALHLIEGLLLPEDAGGGGYGRDCECGETKEEKEEGIWVTDEGRCWPEWWAGGS